MFYFNGKGKMMLVCIMHFSMLVGGVESDIYDNSWALIIGIDRYENVQNLNYAVKDADMA